MVEAFVERIAKLDEKKKKAILASMQRGDHGVVINSAFEIPINAQEKITKVVRNHIGDGIDIRYQIAPDMILGIELKTHGHKIAWSIDDYLDSLEESVSQALSGEMEDRSIGRRANEKVQLKHPRKRKQKGGKR
jgi:F-type H+-transporting ATPase subunit b